MKKKNIIKGSVVYQVKTKEKCLKILEEKKIEEASSFPSMHKDTLDKLFGNKVKVSRVEDESDSYMDVEVYLLHHYNISQWIPHEFLKKVTKEEIQE